VKGKAGRGAGIVVGMITMTRKSATGNMEESGAGAGAGAETVTGKGGGTEEGTMTTRGVGSATVIVATGEERNDRGFCSSHTLLLPIFVAVEMWWFVISIVALIFPVDLMLL